MATVPPEIDGHELTGHELTGHKLTGHKLTGHEAHGQGHLGAAEKAWVAEQLGRRVTRTTS